jgi:hypothetical protein
LSAEALLRTVVAALREAGIPSMLTGSIAAAYHGASRATMDLDLVIEANPDQLGALVAAVSRTGVYVSHDAALEAVRNESTFNVIDGATGWKADLIVRKTREFSTVEFDRRQPTELMGIAVDVASLEDVILSKLEWAKLGRSARQIDDVRALLRVNAETVDRGYLQHWIEVLGLADQWRSASDDAQASR